MTRNRTTPRRAPAPTARGGPLPGLPRFKLARAREAAPAAPRALPDPSRLSVAREDAWPRAAAENYRLLVAGIAAALAVHALALWLVLPRAAPELPSGSGGQYLEAIEVSIVRSAVIESRDRKAEAKDSGGSTEMKPNAGARADAATPPEAVPPQADEPLQKREARTPPANDGATARAIEENPRAAGPAAASPGAVSQYAARVREALARNRPSGSGRRGTATIKFTLSPAGKVDAAEVENSSGLASLDHVAIEAVRETAFPVPPAAMTETQRTFVVPFHFK
jgi:TonB family protein